MKRAKVQQITPHDLRTIMVPTALLALRRILGHKSAKVTLDTYADLFDADLDAVAASGRPTSKPENTLLNCTNSQRDLAARDEPRRHTLSRRAPLAARHATAVKLTESAHFHPNRWWQRRLPARRTPSEHTPRTSGR